MFYLILWPIEKFVTIIHLVLFWERGGGSLTRNKIQILSLQRFIHFSFINSKILLVLTLNILVQYVDEKLYTKY